MNHRLLALVLIAGCATSAPAPKPEPVTPARVAGMVAILAADSMEGRMTGSPGGARAANWIATQMRLSGLQPAGDSGFFQRIPMAAALNGRPMRLASFAARDTFPAARRLGGANIVGILPGGDPSLTGEVVLVTAHYDHVGIRKPVNGDSIYNGADDNASGTVTMLEVARVMRQGPPPRRTVVFAALTGEELGGFGTRWYLEHPVRPL